MAYQAKKTEHAGPKRGRGGYWGPKQAAKKESSKIRRRNWRRQISQELESCGRTIDGAHRFRHG